MVKRLRYLILIALMLSAVDAYAGTSDTVTINYSVEQVCSVALSSATTSMQITGSSRDGDYIQVVNNVLSMAMTSNVPSRKIIASLSENMAANTWLYMTVSVPEGWSTNGETLITSTPATLASGGVIIQGGLSISMRFRAYVMAGPISTRSVTVYMTIMDNV